MLSTYALLLTITSTLFYYLCIKSYNYAYNLQIEINNHIIL